MTFDPQNPTLDFAITVIGGIISLVSLIATIFPLTRKMLTFEILSNEITLTHVVDNFYVEMAKVIRDKKAKADSLVTGADRLIVFRMVNSGWRNIKRDDFDGNNILIDFGEKAKILSAGIAKTGPSNIRHEVKVTTKNITIPPLLIKSNESMTFCVEVENYQEIKVDARIDGKEKTTKNLNPMRSLFLYNIGITIFISFGLPFVFSLPVVVAVKVILILFLFFITAALKVELMKRKILDKYVFERL